MDRSTSPPPTAEHQRLEQDRRREANWKRWGPYLSERQWGTVREDYSAGGDSWNDLPHDHARSRAYRWGEDGLLGICDRQCRLCFGLALWNGADPILKERLFGLTGPQGNHGEDVKEYYYYLDSTPTHSYLRGLYKYPHQAYPYERLVTENRHRGKDLSEFELIDTGVFSENRYFDVTAEYAKGGPDDILIRITVTNHGPDQAELHLLPTLWFRNTWSWQCEHEGCEEQPSLRQVADGCVEANHPTLGKFHWHIDHAPQASDSGSSESTRSESEGESSQGNFAPLWFTENETNHHRLHGKPNPTPVKDAFHEHLISGRDGVLSDRQQGTKAAAHFHLRIESGKSRQVLLRLRSADLPETEIFGESFRQEFQRRIEEADQFYAERLPAGLTEDQRLVARQAYAGLFWTKQFYHYAVAEWLQGDPAFPPSPPERRNGRNKDWPHLFNRDILSMPDKWEYPWYAAWDLAFHMLPFAHVDPQFAKEQLVLLLREWYMHPNGQIPAYEFCFSDVNPPVHAWACWRVYKIAAARGERDQHFLKRVFQKLIINFTWWVNRKDVHGKHIFSGGFLGLDNIGIFDRSKPLPTGGHLEQADGTAWMAFYSATMLSMAIELAKSDSAYEDVASKFFEHFVAIVDAMNCLAGSGLWNEDDGFYYDVLQNNGAAHPLKIRSMVGILPLCAVEILEEDDIQRLGGFRKRLNWFLQHRQDLARHIAYLDPDPHQPDAQHGHKLLAVPSRERLIRMLHYILDENEFLSPFGIRSMSKVHLEHPYTFWAGGEEHRVSYSPGESTSYLFGGNSNWRGPVWLPVNYLIVESLEKYHYFYGDSLKVECPTGSGHWMTLGEVAREISRRLTRLFLRDSSGHRPCHGRELLYRDDPRWQDLVLFHEYFHGDDGHGLGASHQTGWTALVTRLLEDEARQGGDST
jgi:hypothetical protein